MTIGVEKSGGVYKNATRRSEFSKVAGCQRIIQKSLAFLYTGSEQLGF